MKILSEGFATVSKGLMLVYIGMSLIVLAMIVSFVSSMARGTVPDGLAALVALGLGITAGLFDVVGKVFCLAVPEKSGSTGFIYGSVTCTVIGMITGAASNVSDLFALTIVSSLNTLAGYLCFLEFLRRLSGFLGRIDLASRARTVLIGTIALLGLYGLMLLTITRGVPWAAMLAIPLLIAGIVFFILYANLVEALRRATRAHSLAMVVD